MDKEEELHLRALLATLDQVEALWEFTSGEKTPAPWSVHPGSTLALDDALTHPHRVSHAAWTAVTVAVDHLIALRATLIREESPEHASAVLHTHAQASLVRGVIENAARAVWLLGPEERLVRVQRRLALQVKEVKDSAKLHSRFKAEPARDEETRLNEVRRLALAAGAPADSLKAFLATPQYTKIVEEGGDCCELGGQLILTFWGACSSLAHGDINGTLGLLKYEIVSQDDETALTRVTGNFSMLRYTAQAGIHLVDRALGSVSLVSVGSR
ncbi:hypothetical protein [Streptomyces sp. NBC_01565]|uniref:hypothetical protein n=1 Tax=unclassified Streptomyces TaxID=2593676 RepID=UPI002251746B|nr:hypothetical protein [Streptomyces sp. NBC_01565]MCX4546755.1 hypothetical protein [Streptomyces sp. NBC_01565]